jgi:hypothetical protein
VEAPRELTVAAETAHDGETCGPIVNKKCASGLCCSGSNFCGTGVSKWTVDKLGGRVMLIFYRRVFVEQRIGASLSGASVQNESMPWTVL